MVFSKTYKWGVRLIGTFGDVTPHTELILTEKADGNKIATISVNNSIKYIAKVEQPIKEVFDKIANLPMSGKDALGKLVNEMGFQPYSAGGEATGVLNLAAAAGPSVGDVVNEGKFDFNRVMKNLWKKETNGGRS